MSNFYDDASLLFNDECENNGVYDLDRITKLPGSKLYNDVYITSPITKGHNIGYTLAELINEL